MKKYRKYNYKNKKRKLKPEQIAFIKERGTQRYRIKKAKGTWWCNYRVILYRQDQQEPIQTETIIIFAPIDDVVRTALMRKEKEFKCVKMTIIPTSHPCRVGKKI